MLDQRSRLIIIIIIIIIITIIIILIIIIIINNNNDNDNDDNNNNNNNKQRILHGHAEIQNFSSSVEKYFTSEHSKQVNNFQHEKRNFLSPSGHVIFYTNEILNHFTEGVERRNFHM